MQTLFFRTTAAALFGLLVLTACSTPPRPKFTQELFETGASPYARNFNSSTTDSCEAARRALLSQGYLTTMSRPDTVDGTKDFQPTSDTHVSVEFHVVCTPGEEAASTSIVYVNAVQNGYALKKSDTSASVGLSVLGSLSLPIRSNSDAMVKISSETIPSGKFYDRFFSLVDHYLQTVVRTQPVTSSPIETRTLPAAAPLQVTTPEPVPEPVPATAQAAVQATTAVPVHPMPPALAQSTTGASEGVTPPVGAQAPILSSAPAPLTGSVPVPLTTPSPAIQLADPVDKAAAIQPASGTAQVP
ncbi:DUF2242 domain-containing protein [Paraburkholderia sp. MMS20-SJTN17]|uniref:DUF2242 domain-containing protein n=1 Tax=Paraburkholderia translucens TaxID=2886945 RepID=A0ABS8KLE3_9BURK|nr:DUF2242 domain-containing protein [Paraburkholderia sp. MMS20-SJTN17]MCC8405535.1 DUF2242 domain-containing protein [Paraburkholderia sp. MMS20-SJTN17]